MQGISAKWINAALWILLAVIVPYGKGPAFLDSVTLRTYLCLSIVFAAPAAIAAFAAPAPEFSTALFAGRDVSRFPLNSRRLLLLRSGAHR